MGSAVGSVGPASRPRAASNSGESRPALELELDLPSTPGQQGLGATPPALRTPVRSADHRLHCGHLEQPLAPLVPGGAPGPGFLPEVHASGTQAGAAGACWGRGLGTGGFTAALAAPMPFPALGRPAVSETVCLTGQAHVAAPGKTGVPARRTLKGPRRAPSFPRRGTGRRGRGFSRTSQDGTQSPAHSVGPGTPPGAAPSTQHHGIP